MADASMPDYANEPNEWESSRPVNFPRPVTVQIKLFTGKIQAARTLQALEHIKSDIQRSMLANNLPAKEQLRKLLNRKAVELGFKSKGGEQFWK